MAITMSTSGFSKILDTLEEEVSQTLASTVTITEQTNQTITVPDATTDLAINLGPVADATGFTLETNVDITIKLNGGSDALPVSSIFVMYGSVTGITVSNASGNEATLKILAGGA